MLEIIVWVLGFIGAGTLWSVFIWSRTYLKSARLFRFRPRVPLDVIVVTSAFESGGPIGKEYRRVLVSFPTVEATVLVGQACGALRLMKDIKVMVSESFHHDLQNDLVLLGGQIKNRVSRRFIEIFNKHYPDSTIIREAHAEERYIKVGKWELRYHVSIEEKVRLPERDGWLNLLDKINFLVRISLRHRIRQRHVQPHTDLYTFNTMYHDNHIATFSFT